MKKFLICLITFTLVFCGCVNNPGGGTSASDQPQSSGIEKPEDQETISIGAEKYILGVGTSKQMEIDLENAENPVFSSDNESVASVSPSGVITGVAPGSAKITVSAQSTLEAGKKISAEAAVSVNPAGYETLLGDEAEIKWLGRTFYHKNAVNCYNTASGFEIAFYGTRVTARIIAAGNLTPRIAVMIDGKKAKSAQILELTKAKEEKEYVLADNLTEGEHVLRVCKITEPYTTSMGIKSIMTDGYLLEPEDKELKIEVYGDSITTGHKNMRTTASEPADSTDNIQNGCLTYAYLTSEALDADINFMARVGIGLYSAWGRTFVLKDNWKKTYLSEYDFLYGGVNPDWDFKKYKPDAVIVNIGTNDVWYDWNIDTYEDELKKFIDGLFEVYGENTTIVIAGGMMTSDNLPVASAVAKKYASGRVGVIELERSAANHPRVRENEDSAELLTDYLRRIIKK